MPLSSPHAEAAKATAIISTQRMVFMIVPPSMSRSAARCLAMKNYTRNLWFPSLRRPGNIAGLVIHPEACPVRLGRRRVGMTVHAEGAAGLGCGTAAAGGGLVRVGVRKPSDLWTVHEQATSACVSDSACSDR